jgi:hypothetical protein
MVSRRALVGWAPARDRQPPDAGDERDVILFLFGLSIAAATSTSTPSMIGEDIEPTIAVVRTKQVEILFGGLLQVHLTPWVGPDALIENGDVATMAGFRIRRARIGFEAVLPFDTNIVIALNPLENDEDVGVLSEARLTWNASPFARISVGASKVPFSRGALLSSRDLTSIERPLIVTTITPTRRVGVTVEGDLMSGVIAYVASVMNATEGFAFGNRFGGLFGGARIEVSPFGRFDARPFVRPVQTGLSIGTSGFYENGPSITTKALEADLVASVAGFALTVEGLCDRRTPKDNPAVSPDIPDQIDRCGAYADLTYAFDVLELPLEADGRVEIFDDNTAIHDSGDLILFAAGLDAEIVPRNLRLQLGYLGKKQRFGPARNADAITLSLLGAF